PGRPDGRPRLSLCEASCPPPWDVRINERVAPAVSGRSRIAFRKYLRIGQNLLTVRRHEPGAQCIAHEPGDIADAEPIHNLRAMRLHGFHRKIEQKGNFLRALAAGAQAQYLALACGEHLRGGVTAPGALHRALALLARSPRAHP